MTVAEHFRDQGKSVLLLMDSVTRFCLALREIGLSAGEPPATRGYPPSVFAELPRLAGAGGPGTGARRTARARSPALFTVLVEGDDHNEPVSRTQSGAFWTGMSFSIDGSARPAATRRSMCCARSRAPCRAATATAENALTRRARAVLALAGEMADLVRLGAYRAGTDPAVDEALALAPRIEDDAQAGSRDEHTDLDDEFRAAARMRWSRLMATTRATLNTLARVRRRALDDGTAGAREPASRGRPRGRRAHASAQTTRCATSMTSPRRSRCGGRRGGGVRALAADGRPPGCAEAEARSRDGRRRPRSQARARLATARAAVGSSGADAEDRGGGQHRMQRSASFRRRSTNSAQRRRPHGLAGDQRNLSADDVQPKVASPRLCAQSAPQQQEVTLRIAMIGGGYVGLVSGACFAEFGVDVARRGSGRRRSWRRCATAASRSTSRDSTGWSRRTSRPAACRSAATSPRR